MPVIWAVPDLLHPLHRKHLLRLLWQGPSRLRRPQDPLLLRRLQDLSLLRRPQDLLLPRRPQDLLLPRRLQDPLLLRRLQMYPLRECLLPHLHGTSPFAAFPYSRS